MFIALGAVLLLLVIRANANATTAKTTPPRVFPLTAAGVDYVQQQTGFGDKLSKAEGTITPLPGDTIEFYNDDGTPNGVTRKLTPENIGSVWNAASNGDWLLRDGHRYRIGAGKTSST